MTQARRVRQHALRDYLERYKIKLIVSELFTSWHAKACGAPRAIHVFLGRPNEDVDAMPRAAPPAAWHDVKMATDEILFDPVTL